jgi:hypothetical protein
MGIEPVTESRSPVMISAVVRMVDDTFGASFVVLQEMQQVKRNKRIIRRMKDSLLV